MKRPNKFLAVICLLTLASCGGSGGPGESGGQEERQEAQDPEGTYKAILRPYNNTLSGWIPNGMADIKIMGDQVEVKTWLDDAANVVHMQNIHMGTRCPTMAADANRDGYVDFAETLNVSKKVLIPLDGNLNSQLEGNEYFPHGNYSYAQKASLSAMMQDLNEANTNPLGHFAKLPSGEALNLDGKVIIVTGVANNSILPASTNVVSELTVQTSMPIACGVIRRLPEVQN